MKLLLIRLHANLKTCDWFLNSTAEVMMDAALHTIPKVSDDYTIIVFVPNIDIHIKKTTIASKQTKQLIQAIPYALEEFLLDDISVQHFAFSNIIKGESQQVAVVYHEKMKMWLELLANHHINPQLLLPEIYLLPVVDGSWCMHTDENYILMRCNSYEGFAVKKSDWPSVAPSVIARGDASPLAMTEKIHIFEFFLNNYPNLFFVDLLQGAYKTKIKRQKTIGVWKTAIILSVMLVALNIFSQISACLYFNYQNHQVQKQIDKIYYATFPTATSLIDPKTRFSRELKNYAQIYSEHGFLSILAALKSVFQVNEIKINHLNFQANKLHIEVIAKNFQALKSFDLQLKNTPLFATQVSKIATGDVIKAEYILEDRA